MNKAKWIKICTIHYCFCKKGKSMTIYIFAYFFKRKQCKNKLSTKKNSYLSWGEINREETGMKVDLPKCTLLYKFNPETKYFTWFQNKSKPKENIRSKLKCVCVCVCIHTYMGFPSGSDSKESACSTGDPDLIPAPGRSPGEGNNFPLQYSCQDNFMYRAVWWATVHGVAKS